MFWPLGSPGPKTHKFIGMSLRSKQEEIQKDED